MQPHILQKSRLIPIIRPSFNDKCPGFFSDFAGKLCAQKPNKAQTKRAHITSVQHFPGFWYCLYAHQQEWCQLFPIIHPLFITLPHNFHRLPSSPPPPAEYVAPPRVRAGLKNNMTASDPRPPKRGRYDKDDVPRRCQPLRQPPRLQGRIHNLSPAPPTKDPPPPDFGNHFSGIDSERKLTMYFTLYYYYLLPLSLSPM